MDDLKIQMSDSDISCDMSYYMNHIMLYFTNYDPLNSHISGWNFQPMTALRWPPAKSDSPSTNFQARKCCMESIL